MPIALVAQVSGSLPDAASDEVSSNFRLATLDSFGSTEEPSAFILSKQSSSPEKVIEITATYINDKKKKRMFSDAHRCMTLDELHSKSE